MNTAIVLLLFKIAAGITSVYVLYTTVIKKWIKAAYARLMEDHANALSEINSKLDVMGKELGFLATAQKVAFSESGIMWWRTDKDGLTIEVSETTCNFLKLTPDRLMGSNWLNQVPSEYHASIMMKFADSIKYKRDFDETFPILKGDGSSVKLHAHAKYGNDDWFGIHRVAS